MKAKIGVEALREWVASVEEIVPEVRLHLREEGFFVSHTDSVQAIGIETLLPAETFEEFDLSGEGDLPKQIGVPLALDEENDSGLSKALGMARDGDDFVTLSRPANAEGHLNVEVGDYFDFKMGLVRLDYIRETFDMSVVPDPTVDLVLDVEEFEKATASADMVSSLVSVTADKDGTVEFVGKGDNGDTSYRLDRGQLGEGSSIPEISSSRYAINYLNQMASAIPSGEVEAGFSQERPLIVSNTLDSGAEVRVLVAPREEL